MFTDVQVINIGLSKIGQTPIDRIDPPRSNVERFVAVNYVHWRRTELTKRRWVFALETEFLLTKVDTGRGERPFHYELPTDCLRPIRGKYSDWRQTGRKLASHDDGGIHVEYVKDVPEAEFDPLFVEVLACRVAMECAEYVTQSNTKAEAASTMYMDAVRAAGQVNAFIIGPEDIQEDDNDFPFLTGRY